MDTQNDELLTEVEAASLLKLKPKTLGDMSRAGRIPRVKLSQRLIRYRRSALEAFVASSTQPATQK